MNRQLKNNMITYRAYKNYHKRNYNYIARLEQFIKDNTNDPRNEALLRCINVARQEEEAILKQYPNYK